MQLNNWTAKFKPSNDKGLDDAAVEASKLGISYGTYMGYKESGYLETFIKEKQKAQPETGNVIESNLHSGSGKIGVKRTHYMGEKI